MMGNKRVKMLIPAGWVEQANEAPDSYAFYIKPATGLTWVPLRHVRQWLKLDAEKDAGVFCDLLELKPAPRDRTDGDIWFEELKHTVYASRVLTQNDISITIQYARSRSNKDEFLRTYREVLRSAHLVD